MVGERSFLNLLVGSEGAVDTEGIDLVEHLHGEEPERAAVDPRLGSSEASERIVRFATVRGATVIHNPAAHGAGEGVPGVRRREVCRGHDRPVLPQLVGEVGEAELGEGRQEERVCRGRRAAVEGWGRRGTGGGWRGGGREVGGTGGAEPSGGASMTIMHGRRTGTVERTTGATHFF
jgi:hypothetical protein